MCNQSNTSLPLMGRFTLILACVLIPACSESQSPVEPGSSGTLVVSIEVTGTRPDPDGYAVSVSIKGQKDHPLPITVESIGGTARFSDLPSGTHSVGVESLAPNCSVKSGSPRPFTIVPGETARIGFVLFCPGPGAVLVRTVSTGADIDPDGYTIALQSTSWEVQIGANDSLLIREEDLPSVQDQSFIRLKGFAANCWTVSRNGLALRFTGDATSRIEFQVTCLSWSTIDSATIYERVSPSIDPFHASSRYILYEGGRFRLEFDGASDPFPGYPGTYSRADSTITFEFHDDSRWGATGTVQGDDCLVVAHNATMGIDFDDGLYCRPSGK